jgi:hypothetical protein
MKKILIIALIAAIFTLASPVAAKDKEPIGESMGWDASEWPAEEPFHICHGWIDPSPGLHSFELYMDDVLLKPSYKIFGQKLGDGTFNKLYYYNFPDGLSGVHTFVGNYYAPCSEYFEDCKNPARPVLVSTISNTVTFIGE